MADGRGYPVGFLPVVSVASGRQEVVVEGNIPPCRVSSLQEQEGVGRQQVSHVESLHHLAGTHGQRRLLLSVGSAGHQSHGSLHGNRLQRFVDGKYCPSLIVVYELHRLVGTFHGIVGGIRLQIVVV